ncbi:MAG: hypothetical protein LC804_09760 [Acidobacteria bacterium]|nr:hypothetical protein [Acidobacteriota bacterium]
MAKKKTSGRKRARKRSTTKREVIDTGRNRSFGKRTSTGRFREMDDAGRSLSGDRRKRAKKKVKSGHGDQGDRSRSRKKR